MILGRGGFNVVGDVRAWFVAEILGGESCRFDSRVHQMLTVSFHIEHSSTQPGRAGKGWKYDCVCVETGLYLTGKAVLESRNDECCHTQRVDGREKKR